MRRAGSRAGRAGFTLIELIVVVTIIILLMGLTASAVYRVQASQKRKATEVQVAKLMSAFDQQWKSVVESARKGPMVDPFSPTPGTDLEPNILAWAGNDTARARALWIRLRLFQEFPHSFPEVLAGNNTYTAGTGAGAITLYANTALGLPRVDLYSKKSYRDALIGGKHTADPGIVSKSVYNTESAALLYLILSTSRGGMAANADEFGANAQGTANIGGKDFNVFLDTYGMPIGFRRFGTSVVHNKYIAELSAPPYVRAGAVSFDPLDPEKKLQTNWNTGNPNVAALLFAYLQGDYYENANGVNAASFTGFPNLNMGPFIFSAGPDKLYHSDDATDLGTSRGAAHDDIVSFRLRRTGERGD